MTVFGASSLQNGRNCTNVKEITKAIKIEYQDEHFL
jgi:hypothetical protein